MYQDMTLVCRDCGSAFTFSAREQEFYNQKGFNQPSRCPACRAQNKSNRGGDLRRKMYDVVCANCGKPTQVPFQPSGDKPVYCRECFQSLKGA